MAVEHAVLGLLSIQPRHGYELAKEFSPDTVLGDIVRLESGMLYAHLKKLERLGWVSAELEPQEARPARKVFEMTPEGEAELHRWLSEPVDKTRDIRLEFLLKLYLAYQIQPERAPRLVAEQQAICRQFIASLESQIATEQDQFRTLVLEMRLAQNRALAGWLERARQVQDLAPHAG
ncbi:MAG TPA: PadR family transcriptional regulator [Thermomicrobiales bacterium]|nr:PadR family transcriptional regulator [Thermomicrobiales bacterium]